MTTKNKLVHFIVKKSGRVVDCVKDKDLCLAFQQAMDRWEHWCAKGERIEVLPMPDAKPQNVVIEAKKQEVRQYSGDGAASYLPIFGLVQFDSGK
jgi:hypothetical protein